jgi:hypothetical protein
MTDPTPEFIDPKEYPDFWEQMKNFKEFAVSVGQNAAEGNGIFVSEEKKQKREQTCYDCSQFNRDSKRCYLCGCFMEVKWKFISSECPMSLW